MPPALRRRRPFTARRITGRSAIAAMSYAGDRQTPATGVRSQGELTPPTFRARHAARQQAPTRLRPLRDTDRRAWSTRWSKLRAYPPNARLADCSVLGDGGAQIGTFCIRRVPVGRWDRPRLLPSPHSGPCCQSSLSVGLVKLMRTDRLPGRTYSQASCWRQALLPGMACRPLRPVGSPWLRKSERAGQTAARGSRGNR
jgi:hypothetical protein